VVDFDLQSISMSLAAVVEAETNHVELVVAAMQGEYLQETWCNTSDSKQAW